MYNFWTVCVRVREHHSRKRGNRELKLETRYSNKKLEKKEKGRLNKDRLLSRTRKRNKIHQPICIHVWCMDSIDDWPQRDWINNVRTVYIYRRWSKQGVENAAVIMSRKPPQPIVIVVQRWDRWSSSFFVQLFLFVVWPLVVVVQLHNQTLRSCFENRFQTKKRERKKI